LLERVESLSIFCISRDGLFLDGRRLLPVDGNS
jgi:hypothetical protein